MGGADFAGANGYALERLEEGLSPRLCYHSIRHTRDEVVPTVELLAGMEGVEGEDLQLLRTAAFYHDIGFLERRDGHEEVSVRMARGVLPGFGFKPGQIEVICGIIEATRLPQSPGNVLEQLMSDADLGLFGDECFWERNRDLRAEWAEFGVVFNDEGWYREQLRFMEGHEYFTEVARQLFGGKKRELIDELVGWLARGVGERV
jgi:uncharacterized protein